MIALTMFAVSCDNKPVEPKEYTVTFETGTESKIEAVKVEEGKSVARPEDPENTGMVLVGWYLGEVEYDFTTPVKADITLKAVWGKAVASEGEFLEALKDGSKPIYLNANLNLGDDVIITKGQSISIVLNSHTIEFTKGGFDANEGKLWLKNGTIIMKDGHLVIQNGGAMAIDEMIVDSSEKGDAIFVINNASSINVSNSTITAKTFCISTNAKTAENYGVEISVNNSKLISTEASAILLNIPGKLNISNCSQIDGKLQSVIVRAGNATIKNSTLYSKSSTDLLNYFETHNWDQGNTVELATLTVGNRNGNYCADAICSLENVKVLRNEEIEGSRTIHVSGGYTVEGTKYKTVLNYDSKSVVGKIDIDKKAADKTAITINGVAQE